MTLRQLGRTVRFNVGGDLMYFAILFSVLASLTVAETMPLAEVAWPYWRLADAIFLTVVLCATPIIVFSRFAKRVDQIDSPAALARFAKRFHLARNICIWAWAVLAPCILAATQWPALVRGNAGVGQTLLLDELLILSPVFASMFACWYGLAGVERALLGRRSLGGQTVSQWSLFSMQARHYFGFLLAPMLFAMFVGDLADFFPERLRGFEWLLPASFVIGLVVLFPLALRRIWPTAPLANGPLRRRLERTSRRVGMQVREILVWKTSGRLVNAAVVGFAGVFRYLMLTDELLNRLSDQQIESVLLHEAAHVRRRHLVVRLVLVGLPLVSWALAMSLLSGGASMLIPSGSGGTGGSFWTAILTPLLVGVYCLAALCWISRLLEFDADLFACRLAAERGMDRAQYMMMLETLSAASGTRRDQRSWLHPSIDERVSLLASLDQSTRQVDSFQRCLRATVGVFILLAAAAPAWILLSAALLPQ